MDAEVTRQLIQRRLQDGRLPYGRVLALPVRRGDGQVCDGCGTIITTDQMARTALVVEDWSTIYLHAECFAIWDVDRLALSRQGIRRATRSVTT